MKTLKYLTTSCYAAAIIGLSAASTYAAELEFYFPVGGKRTSGRDDSSAH